MLSFVNFFANHLPRWTVEKHNSTSKTPVTGDREIPSRIWYSAATLPGPPW